MNQTNVFQLVIAPFASLPLKVSERGAIYISGHYLGPNWSNGDGDDEWWKVINTDIRLVGAPQ